MYCTVQHDTGDSDVFARTVQSACPVSDQAVEPVNWSASGFSILQIADAQDFEQVKLFRKKKQSLFCCQQQNNS